MLDWFGKLIGKLVRSWVWTYLGFQSGAVVKNLPGFSPAGAIGDVGSIPESETCPGIEKTTHCNILASIIPWTEEPGRLQSTGSQRVRHDSATKHRGSHRTHDGIRI